MFHSHRRSGFTVIELLVSMGVIGLLIALLLPAVQSVREQSRGTSCTNHLGQLAKAALAHEGAMGHFPLTSTLGKDAADKPHYKSAISPHRSLMRFLDPVLAKKVSFDDPTTPSWKHQPLPYFVDKGHKELHQIEFALFLCPSDPSPLRRNNYRANVGTSVRVGALAPPKTWGAFTHGHRTRISEIVDGTSQTVMFSERVRGDADLEHYTPFTDIWGIAHSVQQTAPLSNYCQKAVTAHPEHHYSYCGETWLLGGYLHTWYNHVHQPNSRIPDCGQGPCCINGAESIITARSWHPGLVHIVNCDGAAHAINQSIDLKVWRAVGTRYGRESETIAF